MIVAPVTKVTLIISAHGGEVMVKIVQNLHKIAVAPAFPPIFVLMIVAVIPHQNLFKLHGNSFCKKLPDKVFLALLRLLLQLAVLLMIKVSQLVID